MRGPTRALACVAVVICAAAAAPAQAQQTSPCDSGTRSYAPVTRAPLYGIGPEENVELPSTRDGAAIAMALFRPTGVPEGERIPVVVAASVYYDTFESLDARRCAPHLIETLVPQGYAVALLAVRGSGSSGGCMNLAGRGERADIDQAITWLGTQPWSSGNVGMYGKSYDGLTQWEAASAGNPHLKTIVPASGVPDLFWLMFGAGAPDWRGAAVIGNLYYLESIGFYNENRRPERTAEVVACPEYAAGNEASLESHATGEVDQLGYWAERRYLDEVLENYRGSVFFVQGLQDWNVNPGQQWPLADELEANGNRVHYMLGQWGHSNPDQAGGAARRPDWGDVLLEWYDAELKGRSNVTTGAEVQDSAGAWRREATWPPAGEQRTFTLEPAGTLADTASGAKGAVLLGPDPAHTQPGAQNVDPPDTLDAGCPATPVGCAAFTTAPVTEPLRIAGLPRLRLPVTPRGVTGHVSAYLYSVDAAGTARRIGWTQADLRFPRGTDERKPVTPGQTTQLDVAVQPLDAVVPAGSRLLLVLSQGTSHNRLASLPPAPIELATGPGTELEITQVTPSAGQFFTPAARTAGS